MQGFAWDALSKTTGTPIQISVQRIGDVRNAMGPASPAVPTIASLVASWADVALWCAILAMNC